MAPTRTTPDVYEEAYNLGYHGKPMTERLKRAAETDHAVFESWRAGRADRDTDGDRAEPKTSATSSSPSTSTTAASGRAPAPKKTPANQRSDRRRTPLSRRRTSGGRTYRAARAVAAPVGTQVGHLLLLGLGLVLLYLVLTSAGAVSGVVGIFQRAVGWVTSPTATI